ncbi:MAG: dihydrolipoyl dehydrogenase [Deltaproteobacteria bacterium HGW-Deltaproteobacteria-12]|jgi:dihydrolipoamide dehydrogenase|nr:MAG: dihydrolipoyl dehydrogenase [Deltaproteobacteria bacterium HGW-Deltaproteobacteria-12]
MKDYDVVIIGGGPGGYAAAVRASQLGLKVALVEKEHLGGVCLNWGCIPTKSLLQNAEVIYLLSKGRAFGFKFDNLSLDYAEAQRRSRSVVSRQARRVSILLKNYGIDVHEGMGRLRNAREVVIEPSGETLKARNIILAGGAKPRPLPGIPFDGQRVVNFRQALELTEVPRDLLIVGAGPIGMEFATLWSRYGAKVTVVEMMPHALPLEDEEVSAEAEKQFKRMGIRIMTGSRVEGIVYQREAVDVTVATGEKTELLSVQKVLTAIGFTPGTEDIGLETAGVKTSHGRIEIDERMSTSIPTIYAIGDITGKLGLAHTASAQAMIAVEAIAGCKTEALTYANIPRCTYAYPEIASVGLTEKQARQQGHDVITAKCPFAANGKAVAMDENFGFVKIVAQAGDKKILGVHLIGAHVTELIAGPACLIRIGATAEQLGLTVHPHPSLSEALMEAAHALMGHAIHL